MKTKSKPSESRGPRPGILRAATSPEETRFNRTDILALAAIAVICLTVFAIRMGGYGFWDPWEPKYVQSVREMIQRGELITPYYNDEIRFTKPILTYWGILASARLLGLTEFSARLSSALMAMVGCLAIYLAVSRLRNRRTGLMAALILGTMPQYFVLARMATTDIYLTAASGGAAACFMLGLTVPRFRTRALVGASAFVSLAVLAKGPVGFIVPAAAVSFFLAWEWRPGIEWSPALRRRVAKALPAAGLLLAGSCIVGGLTLLVGAPKWWWYDDLAPWLNSIRETVLGLTGRVALAGESGGDRMPQPAVFFGITLSAALAAASLYAGWRLLRAPGLEALKGQFREAARQAAVFLVVGLIVAGPWYIGVLVKHGGFWVEGFIGKHNIHRAGVEMSDHGGKTDFYLRAAFFAVFPWVTLLPVCLGFLWRAFRYRATPVHRAGVLAVIWLVMVFGLYNMSNTKFYHYMAPALPIAAILIALAIDHVLTDATAGDSRTWLAVGAGLFVLCCVMLSQYDFRFMVNMFTVKLAVPKGIENWPVVRGIWVLWGAAVTGILVGKATGRLRQVSVVALFTAAVGFALYFNGVFMPQLAVHKTLKPLIDIYEAHRTPGEPVALYGKMKHGMVYYTDRKARMLGGNGQELMKMMTGPGRIWCILRKVDLPRIQKECKSRGVPCVEFESPHFDYTIISNRR